MVDLKQVLTSAAVSIAAIVASLTMGFGRHTAETIYTTDGTNVQQLVTAMNTKLDTVTGVLSDAINSGTKKVRTDVIDQAKDAYRQETARIKAEAEAAKRIAEQARQAIKSNPAATLLGN